MRQKTLIERFEKKQKLCRNHYANWAYAELLHLVFARYPYAEYENQLVDRINELKKKEIDPNHYIWKLRVFRAALKDLRREDEKVCEYCERSVPESQLKRLHAEIIPNRTDLFYWCGKCDPYAEIKR